MAKAEEFWTKMKQLPEFPPIIVVLLKDLQFSLFLTKLNICKWETSYIIVGLLKDLQFPLFLIVVVLLKDIQFHLFLKYCGASKKSSIPFVFNKTQHLQIRIKLDNILKETFVDLRKIRNNLFPIKNIPLAPLIIIYLT